MARNNQIQYIRPRCPKCKKITGKRLGYELDYKKAGDKARITCRLCRYSWLSTNSVALAELQPAAAGKET